MNSHSSPSYSPRPRSGTLATFGGHGHDLPLTLLLCSLCPGPCSPQAPSAEEESEENWGHTGPQSPVSPPTPSTRGQYAFFQVSEASGPADSEPGNCRSLHFLPVLVAADPLCLRHCLPLSFHLCVPLPLGVSPGAPTVALWFLCMCLSHSPILYLVCWCLPKSLPVILSDSPLTTRPSAPTTSTPQASTCAVHPGGHPGPLASAHPSRGRLEAAREPLTGHCPSPLLFAPVP